MADGAKVMIMKRGLQMGIVVAAMAVLGVVSEASAGIGMAGVAGVANAEASRIEAAPVKVAQRSRKPQVRGFVRRGGYYSYHPEDSINTYGDSRTRYGSASFYRNQTLDSQTRFGPFDHGFFYDSGITTPYGGNSPYMH